MNAKRIPNASTLSGWRKSSYSGGDNGSCLEVVNGLAGVIPVRDSKAPHGPALVLSNAAWASFIGAVRTAAV
ncbi:DUF397 domain-containing protein [Streptomyces venezuelae]|uniref:DUF397 domain-containing protein n=1 Tax=Streptomyces venezuelae TaxID=54571 RepID=UPI00365351C1